MMNTIYVSFNKKQSPPNDQQKVVIQRDHVNLGAESANMVTKKEGDHAYFVYQDRLTDHGDTTKENSIIKLPVEQGAMDHYAEITIEKRDYCIMILKTIPGRFYYIDKKELLQKEPSDRQLDDWKFMDIHAYWYDKINQGKIKLSGRFKAPEKWQFLEWNEKEWFVLSPEGYVLSIASNISNKDTVMEDGDPPLRLEPVMKSYHLMASCMGIAAGRLILLGAVCDDFDGQYADVAWSAMDNPHYFGASIIHQMDYQYVPEWKNHGPFLGMLPGKDMDKTLIIQEKAIHQITMAPPPIGFRMKTKHYCSSPIQKIEYLYDMHAAALISADGVGIMNNDGQWVSHLSKEMILAALRACSDNDNKGNEQAQDQNQNARQWPKMIPNLHCMAHAQHHRALLCYGCYALYYDIKTGILDAFIFKEKIMASYSNGQNYLYQIDSKTAEGEGRDFSVLTNGVERVSMQNAFIKTDIVSFQNPQNKNKLLAADMKRPNARASNGGSASFLQSIQLDMHDEGGYLDAGTLPYTVDITILSRHKQHAPWHKEMVHYKIGQNLHIRQSGTEWMFVIAMRQNNHDDISGDTVNMSMTIKGMRLSFVG